MSLVLLVLDTYEIWMSEVHEIDLLSQLPGTRVPSHFHTFGSLDFCVAGSTTLAQQLCRLAQRVVNICGHINPDVLRHGDYDKHTCKKAASNLAGCRPLHYW